VSRIFGLQRKNLPCSEYIRNMQNRSFYWSWWNQWFHPDPASKQSAKPVWHIPIAVYTVLDSSWWTESLSERCRLLFQK